MVHVAEPVLRNRRQKCPQCKSAYWDKERTRVKRSELEVS